VLWTKEKEKTGAGFLSGPGLRRKFSSLLPAKGEMAHGRHRQPGGTSFIDRNHLGRWRICAYIPDRQDNRMPNPPGRAAAAQQF